MPGSIALVGSGEYLPAMLELEKSLIQDAIAQGKKATFVQIPTAVGQVSEDSLENWRSIGRVQADR